jgi:cell wall-associated NlpC family hydrolase
MYFNISSGVLTNTTIPMAIFPSIYQNTIAYIDLASFGSHYIGIGLYNISSGEQRYIMTPYSPYDLFDTFDAIDWVAHGLPVLSLSDSLLACYGDEGAWCYDRTDHTWTGLGYYASSLSVYKDTVAFQNLSVSAPSAVSTIVYYNSTTDIVIDTGVEGTNPSMFESIITFRRKSTSPPYATIRYYNVTSSTETDTGIVGDGASIYADRIVFATNETFAGTDLNGDGELNASIIRFYDIWSGGVINTWETGLGDKWLKTSIYGDTIVFVDEFFTSLYFVRFVTAHTVIATQAAQLAISLIGAEYRHGKGWNWSAQKNWNWIGGHFLSADEIKNGYWYLYRAKDHYDKTQKKWIYKDTFEFGRGVDCSGLVYWSYNFAYGTVAKYSPDSSKSYVTYLQWDPFSESYERWVKFFNPVPFQGAHLQWKYSVEIEAKDLQPGDLLFFDTDADRIMDHTAMFVGGPFVFDYGVGQHFTYNTVESTSWGDGKVTVAFCDQKAGTLKTLRTSTGNTRSLTITHCGRVGFPLRIRYSSAAFDKIVIRLRSPVSLNISNPEGASIAGDIREVENMVYLELDESGSGNLDDAVLDLEKTVGDYCISISPKPEANPTDTYTLEVSSGNATTVLASNVLVSEIPSQPYIVTSNETAVIPRLDLHDIGIQSVDTSKNVIGQNRTVNIDITIFNYGQYSENINTTLFVNEQATATQNNVILESRNAITLTFAWNTTGIEYGNYTISAHSWPVLNETYTSDNIFVAGNIVVTIPGDVNGNFVVDIYDAILLSGHYNQTPINPLWNANIDINGDNIVDIFDAIILANHYNQHYP